MADRPWRLAPDRATLAIRARPGARRDAIAGLALDADGRPLLVVHLRAAAVDGKANAALLAHLAQSLGCQRSQLELVHGATGRLKRVVWRDPPADAGDRLEALLAPET